MPRAGSWPIHDIKRGKKGKNTSEYQIEDIFQTKKRFALELK